MNIVRKLPADTWYQIRSPKNFYSAMRSDVELLLKHRAYVSLATVIVYISQILPGAKGIPETRIPVVGQFQTDPLPEFLFTHIGSPPPIASEFDVHRDIRNNISHPSGVVDRFLSLEEVGEMLDYCKRLMKTMYPHLVVREHWLRI
ncbi:MAG: hypothetical protein ABSG03_40795 [Bryobacteraceae bacterium]|jgi:hypothetical protein